MRINRFLLIAAALFLLGCEYSDAKTIDAKQTVKEEIVNIVVEDSIEINGFTVSCGSGCAMIYSEKSSSAKDQSNQIELIFEVQLMTNEMLTDTYEEVYLLDVPPKKTLNIYAKSDGSIIDETLAPNLVRELKKYASKFYSESHLEFRNANKGNDETVYSRIIGETKLLTLPISYSYDFIMDFPDFSEVEHASAILELDQLSELKFARLKSVGETRVLIASGYMESGQSEMFLLTLNDAFEVVDSLKLYSFKETEEGGILTRFKINKDYTILVIEEEMGGSNDRIISQKKWQISEKGNFHKID